MTEERRSHSLMVPMLAAAAGAGIALLFAPRSGRETRERLRMKAHDVQEKAKQGYDSARQQAGEKVSQAKDMKNRVSEAIKTSPTKSKRTNTQETWEEV